MDTPNVEIIFKDQLALIESDETRDFVIEVFKDHAPQYFWTTPASTSGRYHPKIALGAGGLVRHTKLAVWWGEQLYRGAPIDYDQYGLDEIVAALLLHDLNKHSGGCSGHGSLFSDRLYREYESLPPNQMIILEGIETHMGKWSSPEFSKPKNKRPGYHRAFCDIVHMADYCASRKVDDYVATLEGGA